MALVDTADRHLFFSQLPLDIAQIIDIYVSPALVLHCRSTDGGDAIVYQPLDNVSQRFYRRLSARKKIIYGFPAAANNGLGRLTLTTEQLGSPGSAKLISLDYMQTDLALVESQPDWVDSITTHDLHPVTGPSIALSATTTMLPLSDQCFWMYSSDSKWLRPTSMVFGSRNRAIGRPLLAATDAATHGTTLISGEGDAMLCYSIWTNETTTIGCPRASARVTCILPMPQTSNFVVGSGKSMFIYDFRQSLRPVQETQALHTLWPTAAMFSDYGIASWNSLHVSPMGEWKQQRHCQHCDLRYPGVWTDAPTWNMPVGLNPLWTTRITSTPRLTDTINC